MTSERAQKSAAFLLQRLDERIERSGTSRSELWQRAGVSKNKLRRAVQRGNIDLAGLLAIILAMGFEPAAFFEAHSPPRDLP